MGVSPIDALLAALLFSLWLGLFAALGIWAARGGSVRIIGAGFLALLLGGFLELVIFLVVEITMRRRLRRQAEEEGRADVAGARR